MVGAAPCTSRARAGNCGVGKVEPLPPPALHRRSVTLGNLRAEGKVCRASAPARHRPRVTHDCVSLCRAAKLTGNSAGISRCSSGGLCECVVL